jgi:hypothetical protein
MLNASKHILGQEEVWYKINHTLKKKQEEKGALPIK